jgi:hypothetical protein
MILTFSNDKKTIIDLSDLKKITVLASPNSCLAPLDG